MTWLRRIFGRKRLYGEISEDIRAHLEEKIEELVANGTPREEAEHAARREFGNVTLTEETAREAWRWPRLEDFLIDIRFALRMLRRSPGFTAIAVLTLALGIGANTAIFSMVNGILVRPLPYRQPQSLYEIYENVRLGSRIFSSEPVTGGNFQEWRRDCHSFAGIALLMPGSDDLGLGSGAVQVHGARASANLLPLLGVQPALGRNFLPQEDQVGRNREIILTYGLWNAYFNSDPGIIGRQILLSGYSYTVVGVLPSNFYFPSAGHLYANPIAGWSAQIDYFVPLALGPAEQKPGLSMENFAAIARVKPGVTREQALADINRVEARIARGDPRAHGATLTATLVPLKAAITGSATASLWVLLAGVGVVLLIVCVNLAGLLLAHSLSRQREVAVRAALGASVWSLLRQFLAEGFILGLTGGGLGLLLAQTGLRVLIRTAPLSIPRVESVSVDGAVLLFTAGISLVAGLLFSVLPALRLCRTPPGEALRSASRTASGARSTMRWRSALAISEIALCCVLLAAAFLLARSLSQVLRANQWLDVNHVLTMNLVVPFKSYDTHAKSLQLYRTLLPRVRLLPGVDAAGIVSALPLQGEMWTDSIEFQEVPQPANSQPNANFRFVSPGYFRAIGLGFLRGRSFAEGDEGRDEVVISESVAKQVLPGRNPVGMHLQCGDVAGTSKSPNAVCEVIGVVGDARNYADQQPPLIVYFPYWVYSPWETALVVRSAADPRSTAIEMRQAVRSLDPQIAVPHEETMSEVVHEAVAPRRFVVLLGMLFSFFAAFLAVLGLYGVISLSAAQRTPEIGIRIALGARPDGILRLVIGQGMALALSGVAIGIAGGLAAARLLGSLLYGVRPSDPIVFLTVALLLTAVALLACYIPARRAMRVDPVTALRNE